MQSIGVAVVRVSGPKASEVSIQIEFHIRWKKIHIAGIGSAWTI